MALRDRDDPAGPPASLAGGRSGGLGRRSSRQAERVSDDLRRRTGSYLRERRRVAGLSLLASGAMGAVAAYQTGLVRRLPEPPVALFDAERVDASGEAYELLKTPDAALGLVSYAVTLALAASGDARRSSERPWLPVALAAKVAADAVGGGIYLTAEQASKHRRFCSWCLLATTATIAMVPQVVPEARAAIAVIVGRGRAR